MSRRLAPIAAVLAAAAGFAAPSGGSSPTMLVGIYDEAHTLYGNPDYAFPILEELRAQVLRVNLYWGGRFGAAKRKPFDGSDPADPAYDWEIYDRTVRYASAHGIKVLFSVWGTPGWANRGRGLNRMPRDVDELSKFVYAAATRYSGTYPGLDGNPLPPVRHWLAWNEPNNPIFLSPQYRREGKKWVVQSAVDYTEICHAVHRGVHATLLAREKVACGATGPRGNNSPTSTRPSVSPLAFLRALKNAGLRQFDAYAHHPYYGSTRESPTTKPAAARGAPPTAVTLANIDDLIDELTHLFGPRRPLWITEYGYQTNPPDPAFGVSWARQARYLAQAFALARRNPRIDMMLWFMFQDEPILSGWQSGLMTASGERKPSFSAFRRLPH